MTQIEDPIVEPVRLLFESKRSIDPVFPAVS